VALGVGLLPAFVPDFFTHFPTWLQTIGGSPITVTAFLAFALNLLFNHLGRRREPDLLKAP
jgi:uric acid transporter